MDCDEDHNRWGGFLRGFWGVGPVPSISLARKNFSFFYPFVFTGLIHQSCQGSVPERPGTGLMRTNIEH